MSSIVTSEAHSGRGCGAPLVIPASQRFRAASSAMSATSSP